MEVVQCVEIKRDLEARPLKLMNCNVIVASGA